ncbi:MAG TPA: 3'-5' exonuclease [Burkholderiaceae bacterium]|nr:3'-5' exonuclease [Burkholderiaceae bacterium]
MFDWLRRPAGRGEHAEGSRWVVLDVETTGLDSGRDSLLSIGAVALIDGRIALADSFEIHVRPPEVSSRDNVLVHGIGHGTQQAAADPREALPRFLDYVGTAPLVAFHAAFDQAFLARAIKVQVGLPFSNPWLDLAELAPAALPRVAAALGGKSLDHWLTHFSIPVAGRHTAAGDALATAMLLQRVLHEVPANQRSNLRRLQALAGAGKWLGAG